MPTAQDPLPTVNSPRDPNHRSATNPDADGTVHVVAGHPRYREAGTARCGAALPADLTKHLPLTRVDCADCRTLELATPFTHAVTLSRYSRGTGPVHGQNTPHRGTSASCTCGWTTRYNLAPSSGGTTVVRKEAQAHLAQIAAGTTNPTPTDA